jgi:hypothetical protein
VRGGQAWHTAVRTFIGGASRRIKLIQQFETLGDCLPRKLSGHKQHRLAVSIDKVRVVVPTRPDPTIKELWDGIGLAHRRLPSNGMPQLHSQCRIRFYLIGIGASGGAGEDAVRNRRHILTCLAT